MRDFWARLFPTGFLVAMGLGWVLITLASRDYFDPEVIAPFVVERLPVRFETLWLNALQVHVATALVTFPLCLFLSTRWSKRHPSWHRWLGRLTGLAVLLLLVPSGVVLSFEAKGGALVTWGFLLSAAIVVFAMVAGVTSARRRDFVAHERAMRHVTAQMSVAVTSRALLIVLDVAGLAPDVAYVVALWVPVLASAAAVEWLADRRVFKNFTVLSPVPRTLP